MNARWFRENLSVVIFGVAFLAVLGGIVWFLQDANAKKAAVQTDYDAQNSELSHLREIKPPLSDASIKNVMADRELINRLYVDMNHAASRKPIEVRAFPSEIDFSLLLRSNNTVLAQVARQEDVQIPDSYAFGFSRYDATLPCHNPTLKTAECQKVLTQLGKQLLIIEKLSHIVMSNKVDQLLAIRRTEVESGGSGDSLNLPIVESPKGLYRTYPFELQFLCDTAALRRIMNDLVHCEYLFVVRSVKIDSSVTKVKVPDTEPPSPVIGETNTIRGIEGPTTVDARRLTVLLRVDLVEFISKSP